VFTGRLFTVSTVMIVTVSISLFGSLILLPLYVQQVLGEPAYIAGLMLLPGGLLSGILAPFVGMVYDKVGPRILILPGAVIATGAMFAFSTLGTSTPVGLVIGMHMLLSVGTALMMTPLMTTALGSVAPKLYSHASAIVNTLQQVAGAAGTALFITLFTVVSTATISGDALTGLADGVGTAFRIGGFISIAGIALALFLRKPDPASTTSPAPGDDQTQTEDAESEVPA
ncbi:MAG: MFS transporter, partial [Microbacterium sp.]